MALSGYRVPDEQIDQNGKSIFLFWRDRWVNIRSVRTKIQVSQRPNKNGFCISAVQDQDYEVNLRKIQTNSHFL